MAKTTRDLITEIALRGVATALPTLGPKDVEEMADAFIALIEALIAGVKPTAMIASTSYRSFCVTNAILDEIEREIPVIVGKIEVKAEVTRSQRRDFHDTGKGFTSTRTPTL